MGRVSPVLLALVVLVPAAFAHTTTSGSPAASTTCHPEDEHHAYFGTGSGQRAVPRDNNLGACAPAGSPCVYPWSNPLTGTGWCDGIPGDFDYEYETGEGGGFFPGGPWATDAICDYGYFPHHGAVPEIDDVSSPASGAAPSFQWGADDTGLGQTGNAAADAGSGYIQTVDPWDAVFGDGQMCLTSGSITPNTDPDDWLQLCVGDASTGTICNPTADPAYPAAGGDGGYWAFILVGTSGTLTS